MTDLIYGEYWMHESFCIFEAQHLRALATEVEAIQACTTLGELARLIPTLTTTWAPDDPDESEVEPADWDITPWAWDETPAVQDGDWPPMPTSNALEMFDDDDSLWESLFAIDGVENVATTLNGDYLLIPISREQELIKALTGAGHTVTRDDVLVGKVGMT